MLNITEQRFAANQIKLSNEISFEILGQQLNFLINCYHDFIIIPRKDLRENAALLYHELIREGYKDPNFNKSKLAKNCLDIIYEYIWTNPVLLSKEELDDYFNIQEQKQNYDTLIVS